MSYKKRTVKRGSGAEIPQEWHPSSRGEGKHAFVEPTPVGLGAKPAKQTKPSAASAPQPAEKTASRPPTTTRPVKKRDQSLDAPREVDPAKVVGGVLGRLILGTPFHSALYKLGKGAERRGFDFEPKRYGHVISYAAADGLANMLPRAIVQAPGFLARKLNDLYEQEIVDRERAGTQVDLNLAEGEGRIRLHAGSLTSGARRSYVEANLTEVAQGLAPEQAAVRQGLRLREQDFYPRIRIGFLEGGEDSMYEEIVGPVEKALNIGQLSLGPLTVLPKDL